MKNFFRNHWPIFVHFGAAAVVFFNASVQAYLGSHLAASGVVGALWAEAMRWAQSPGQTSGSKF